MITEYGIEAKSNAEIISELGGRFKDTDYSVTSLKRRLLKGLA